MKLLAFKNKVIKRAAILKSMFIYSLQNELAYRWSQVGGMFATLFFLLVTIVFIDVIYSNVDTIAGYERNEFLVFLFLGELVFQLNVRLLFNSISALAKGINTGKIDSFLIKPLPHLFYFSLNEFDFVSFIKDTLGSLIIFITIIDWSALNLTYINVLAGLLIALLGVLITATFQFIIAMMAFWIGESESLVDSTWAFEYDVGRRLPFEFFDKGFQIIFSTIVPVLISTGIGASVILGKSEPVNMLLLAFSILTILEIIKRAVWSKGLKAYTSASS